MRKSFKWLAVAVMVLGLFPLVARAEDEKGEIWKFYKLDFVVRELEGEKTVSTRNYTLMTKSGDWQQLRVGTRVPISTEEKKISYTDVGLSVDCRILDGPRTPFLVAKAEISSFANAESEKSGTPLMRHVQMNTSAPITLGKPVVISGVDELTSNHRFQLEVTATELK
ncbi:MAG TPA: hypothetical protein VFW45_10110 [Candidatus Polarisedimenticolia bacterium]|nr:hypothetical protein [Candidatus Polarisedimenticolia bacterium]